MNFTSDFLLELIFKGSWEPQNPGAPEPREPWEPREPQTMNWNFADSPPHTTTIVLENYVAFFPEISFFRPEIPKFCNNFLWIRNDSLAPFSRNSQFFFQKFVTKIPKKICNIIFWIGNVPLPLLITILKIENLTIFFTLQLIVILDSICNFSPEWFSMWLLKGAS